MKKTLLLLLFFVICFSLFSQQIWYVKSHASGANTGLSWEDAFTDLQSALQSAQYGDDIWVAQGVYQPNEGVDRNATFDLPTGVRLAGGFAGTETLFGERDWEHNTTILNGNTGDPEKWTDNNYHVVSIYGGDSLTMLDGFKIMRGVAIDSGMPWWAPAAEEPFNFGGGVLVWANSLRSVSAPQIRNCMFESNYARSGGAVACIEGIYTASPRITGCRFLYNHCSENGGAIYKVGNSPAAHPFTIVDCIFTSNYGSWYSRGGALFADVQGQTEIRGCSFNSCFSYYGGATFLAGAGNARHLIDNCDFSSNTGAYQGGAIYHVQANPIHITKSDSLIIRNSSFSANQSRNGAALYSYIGSDNISSDDRLILLEAARFENNISDQNGALFITSSLIGGEDLIEIKADRCMFLNNRSFDNSRQKGGAFYSEQNTSNRKLKILFSNSIFAYNAGAIADVNVGGNDKNAIGIQAVNCTFLNNGPTPFSKPWYPDFDAEKYWKVKILNSLIWEEEVSGSDQLFNNNADVPPNNVLEYTVEHSLVNLSGCAYEGSDPCGEGMVYELSPQFASMDSAQLNLSIPFSSPAHNKGSNLVAETFGLQYDYLGHPRIYQDTVDIGALEYDTIVTSTLEPFFEKESFLLQVKPTLLSAGEPLQVCLLNLTIQPNFTYRLLGVDGREWYHFNLRDVPAQIPACQAFSTSELPPGVYFLSVNDGRGQQKTQKFMVK